jgi:hypothetical protein
MGHKELQEQLLYLLANDAPSNTDAFISIST